MKERKLDFKVYLPQLEVEPGRFKGGVKRYHLRKNENSPALMIGGDSFIYNSNQGSPTFSSVLRSASLENHSSKMKPLMGFTPRPKMLKDLRNPVKITLNDPIHNYMLEFSSHPAFQQPKFTKNRLKPLVSNPITGISHSYFNK